jgi:hypothetical protein
MRASNLVPLIFLAVALTACDESRPISANPTAPTEPRSAKATGPSALVVNVSNDTTAQNETPLAVNPLNSQNFITGGNDWNYNDGCSVNATFDAGKTWTKTLPNGFIPGITKYTNDPSVAGTGLYDFGGDPAVAFGPDGTAYFACFGYQASSPYGVALLLSRSTDGGRTWLSGGAAQPLTLVTAFQGNGKARGSTGQFADHDAMTVGSDGTIYVTWAQFHGNGSNSPVFVATSSNRGRSFTPPVKVTSGTARSDQDQRIATNADGSVAYLTFDNSIQGGKGTAMFVSRSTDHGQTWGTPVQLGTFASPVCLFPPYCFNITGGEFRGPGSYPVPAYNNANGRLYVAYADIVDGQARILITSASAANLASWTTPSVVASVGSGDRFASEMSIAPNGRIDVAFYDRSYSGNALVDVTYANSADFGATWQSTRVTKSGFDPSQYGVPSGSGFRPFIGDYNGIVSLPGSAAMTWTGVGETYGTLPTNLEIYFGSVTP